MDISSAASSLYSSSPRYGDQKKSSGSTSDFLAMLSGNSLSSLQARTLELDRLSVKAKSTIDGLPVEKTVNLDSLPVETMSTIDGLPVEKTVNLNSLPVETMSTIDGLPVEPDESYVDPQILLTQKLAASLMSGVWRPFDPPSAV